MGLKGRAGLGQRQILRLSSHCFAFTFSNIRHFTPLRMTKRGDARRSLDSSFPFGFPVIDRRIANEKDFSLRSK